MRTLLSCVSLALFAFSEPIRMHKPDVEPPEAQPSPAFEVERLDAPIERIEIRLIDENSTSPLVIDIQNGDGKDTKRNEATRAESALSADAPSLSAVDTSVGSEDARRRELYAVHNDIDEASTQSPTHSPPPSDEAISTESPSDESPSESPSEETPPSTTPISAPTISDESDGGEESRAEMRVFGYPTHAQQQSDDYDSPSTQQSTGDDEPEPVEECLGNQRELSLEVVERLKEQARKLNRLIRRLNKQQMQYCQTEPPMDEYRQCTVWREEKLVHYYQLMRVTYCSDYSKWPNAPRIKRNYPPETLHFYETLYAFTQKA